MKIEKPIIIELYEFWNTVKARFNIIAPQPKSFNLKTSVQPVLSIDAFKLTEVDITATGTVAHAPTTEDILLQPPRGKIYQVVSIYCYILDPIGSAAGYHNLHGYPRNDGTSTNSMFSISSNTGSNINIGQNSGFTGTTEQPGGAAQQQPILNDGYIWASYDVPFLFKYKNATDVDQTGDRTLILLVKEYSEGA